MEEENKVAGGRFFKVIVPIIAILAVAAAGYFYNELRTLKTNPNVLAQREASELVSKVGKLYVLPEGEVPTVATVADPEALKDQAFFKTAQQGDKVLIYAEARKAVLYSVTLGKILEVAPLNIGGGQSVSVPRDSSE